MSVHQVIGNVCVRLVQTRVDIGRSLHFLILYTADIEYVAAVRRNLVVADAVLDVAQAGLFAELVSL